MFSQASVILLTGGGGVYLSACWDTHTPQSRHPPGADTPPEQDTPQNRHPREQTPPLEQTPPRSRHTHPPWKQTHTPPGKQTHTPTPREQTSPPEQTHPPWEQTPPRSRHTPLQSMLGDTVNTREVRILLEYNLVFTQFWGENWSNNSFSCPRLELPPSPPGEILDPPL